MLTSFKKVIDAATETTTSDPIDVKYAKKVLFMFQRANHSSGSSAFKVSGSIDDGTTYIDINLLRDNATGVMTLVGSKTLNADGYALVSLDLDESGFAFDYIKVTVTETTDGTHSASVYVVR
ncbi:hypothetical protein HGB07_05760 [Candidatus Roizmanbacteria bacterium]|nr:hypothetical protein [Candidatus Roizmanbacteria bacterium]